MDFQPLTLRTPAFPQDLFQLGAVAHQDQAEFRLGIELRERRRDDHRWPMVATHGVQGNRRRVQAGYSSLPAVTLRPR